MDSGIDSTESSNGSVEEDMTPPMDALGVVVPAHNNNNNNAGTSSSSSLSSSLSSSSSIPPSTSPSSASTTSEPCSLKVLGGIALAAHNNNVNAGTSSLSSSSSIPSNTASEPSSLKVLAASTINEIQTSELVENENQNEAVPDEEVQAIKTPPNTPAHTHTFQLGKTEFPEGSRLQLHFPMSSPSSLEGIKDGPLDLEPPSGLTFANVSPSMCLSHGYEAYSQGYAVLPYEHNVLKKKLRTLRLRMRQHHYKILCSKSKERKLRIAVGLNNVQSVEQLLKEGVDPKVTDNKDRSPLHIAASKGYSEIARLLLQYGADPNQRDAIGNTALHLAACTSHIPMVTLLLKAGTNVRQADNQGYSPLHLARSKLKLLQRDNASSSCDIKKQVYQVIEMMQTFLECSGSAEEAELLTCFTTQLSLSDTRQDVQALLSSLNNLSLTAHTDTTTATTTTTTTA